jgi:hypothetical protein
VGDGSVNLQRLQSDGFALLLRQRVKGAQIMQSVGEFDEDHADILRHCHQHLPKVLHLLLAHRAEMQSAQLRHAFQQSGELFAELRLAAGGKSNSVSSTTSCKRAAMMLASSSPKSVTMMAT